MTVATETTAAARTYAIDKAHSEVTFQVRHLLTRVRGRFTDFAGAIHDQPQGVGLMWNAALETGGFLVGDDVQISLSIQAIAQ